MSHRPPVMPAAWAAVHDNGHCVVLRGYGLTPQAAAADARRQWADAPLRTRLHMDEHLQLDPLTPEQASEVAEMLATDWP